MIKAVLERGLKAELSGHLGYENGDPAARMLPNPCNGACPKTLASQVGDIDLAIPNDIAAVKLLWLAICNIEEKRANERAKLHGKIRDSRHKCIHKLIEGSQSQGWTEALAVLAMTYPERLEAYMP